jgi:acetoin utilization deacetylase AcuC-like enzyme
MPLPPGHRFPARKYGLLREMLSGEPGFRLSPATPATMEDVGAVHDAGYVSAFVRGELEPGAMRRIGFPWSEGLVARTSASAGGTICAVRAALAGGELAGALAGGTHHAFRAEGSGFCVFNDIAIAAAWLRRNWYGRRIAVIDLDVHQGDGTAAIMAGDNDVLSVSIHGKNNFPFRKQRSGIDVALADGAGDEEYLCALAEVLKSVEVWAPEFVFYQSGVDALAEDTLGKLALTREGLAARDSMVLSLWRRAGFGMAITLGGGYATPIELTVAAHAQTYRQARQALVNGRETR